MMNAKRYIAVLIGMTLLFGCGDFIERTYILPDFTVTYDARGGTIDGNEVKTLPAQYGQNISLPSPVNPGYELLGWYSEPRVGGVLYGKGGGNYEMEAADIKMYARWRSYLPIDTALGERMMNGIVCVWVDSGTFIMGSPPTEPGRIYDETQRVVTLTEGFWIAKYPTTNRQYAELFPNKQFRSGNEDHPVVNVNWDEAMTFAEGIGATLPTEAQWEFAARGGNFGKYSGEIYSGGNLLSEVAWHAGNSDGATREVGQKRHNQLRIHDMSGNVSEWVYDRYGFHDDTPVTDPEGPNTGVGRVHRGGGWNSVPRECRVADRPFSNPSEKRGDIGFRVVFMGDR